MYGIKGQGFADNCGPLIGGNKKHEMYKKMQRMLNRLHTWGKSKNLTFNPNKSVAVLFSKKHKPRELFLKMDGKDIKHSTTVKYLVITLDRRLNWRKYIQDKIDS